MVSSTHSANKGTAISAPVMLSPISVSHSNQMLEHESGPSTGNAIRDQWVANLKKKRVAAAAGTGDPIGNGNPHSASLTDTSSGRGSNSNSRSSSTKKSSRSRSANSRSGSRSNNNRSGSSQLSAAGLEKSLNSHQRNAHRHSQFATMPSNAAMIVDSQISMSDADALAFGHPTTFFGGLGCFELESPSYTGMVSSSLDVDFALGSPVPETSFLKKGKSRPKRITKTGTKKRPTHCLAVDPDQPKPHTPRRKLNCGAATFDDFDLEYNVCSGPSSFPGVGTPSNFHMDPASGSTRHIWGPEIDITGPGGYADTFLDLPTPRVPEMPLVTSQQSNNGKKAHSDQEVERLDQPRLIRTNSIEQEGLSHFLEQTNLDGSDGGHGDELYRLAASSPLVTTHKSPFSDRFFFPSNQDSSSYPHTSVAAAAVVDECFPNKTQVSASWTIPSPSPLEPSSKAAMRRRMTPRDKKNPEFETLLDEYKLTDIDHELDSFYLDTMEAIGNDLDLMSN